MTPRTAVAGLLAFLASFTCAEASGPFFTEVIFVSDAGNDYDDPGAVYRGDIGILQSTFARNPYGFRLDIQRLYGAYRILSGKPFADAEIEQLRQVCCVDAEPATQAVLEWLDAREALPGVAPIEFIDTSRAGSDGFFRVDNCKGDAFRTAARTLRGHIAAHSDTPGDLRDWLAGQDAVFANCSADAPLPPLRSDAPAWLKADRAYQEAAALFYQAHYAEAAAAFTQIAADQSSPWRNLSAYLVARSWGRKAVSAPRSAASIDAAAAARSVLADPSLSRFHAAAQMILFQIDIREHAPVMAEQLAASLMADELPPDLQQRVIDFGMLTQRGSSGHTDLGAWIGYVIGIDRADPAVALRNWREKGTLPWLVTALMAAGPDDPGATALIEDALLVEPGSPAFPMAIYHRNRLRTLRGELEVARADLDRALAADGLGRSTRNLLMMARQSIARDLSEFLAFGAMTPAGFGSEMSGSPYFGLAEAATLQREGLDDDFSWRWELATAEPRYFDRASGLVFGGMMPLDLLRRASSDPDLPSNLARDLVKLTLVRAILLDRHRIGQAMARRMIPDHPRIAGALHDYAVATPDDRAHAAAFLLLHLPGAHVLPDWGFAPYRPADQIGPSGNRWWWGPTDAAVRFFREDLSKLESTPICGACGPHGLTYRTPVFLSPQVLERASAEVDGLFDVPDATRYLAERVFAWSKSRPGDPRLPKALHLLVRLTRYGPGGSDISRRAFAMLHERYPDSEWTTRTPYWY